MKRYREKSHAYVTPPDASASYEDRLRFLKAAIGADEWDVIVPYAGYHERLTIMRYNEPVTVEGRAYTAAMGNNLLRQALAHGVLSDEEYHAWVSKLHRAKETSHEARASHVDLVDQLRHNPDVFLDAKRTEQVTKLVAVLVKQYDFGEVVSGSFLNKLHEAEFYRELHDQRILRRLKYHTAHDQMRDALGLLTRAAEFGAVDDEIPSLARADRQERMTTYSQILEQVAALVQAQAAASFHAHAHSGA